MQAGSGLWGPCPMAQMNLAFLGAAAESERSLLTPPAELSSSPEGETGQIKRKSESWGPGS